MEIVIDIPEGFYEEIKRFGCVSVIHSAVINGTPLEKVLEDIKTEIDTKRIRKNPKNDFIDGYNLAIFDALEIIDKHISGKEQE